MAGFPNSPSIGETYTLGTKVWEWDGTIWKIKTTGAVGPQGVQGAQGNQGTAGSAGSAGVQGPQGNQGRQGVSGPQGNQGRQGIVGTDGNQGNQGRQGISGPQGNQGRQGISGPQGNQGRQGFQGNQGLKGDQGNQGNQGLKGDQGNQGIAGVTGSVSTPADISTLIEGKVRVSPLWATVDLSGVPDGDYWIHSTESGTVSGNLLYGIEYDYGSQLVRFNRYTETSVSIGNAAAALTADLRDGNIFKVSFGGYTGACTINITGNAALTNFVENIVFYFENSAGNTAPTISFTSKGETGKVLFSEETGAPVFSNTPQVVFFPMVFVKEGLGQQYWYGGSQLTFNL